MKIGDKTYELILPEFNTNFDEGCCYSEWNNNMTNLPYEFNIDIDCFDNELNAEMYYGDDCTILKLARKYDHELTQVDYIDFIHELQQAYKEWVFETLFKEIKDD